MMKKGTHSRSDLEISLALNEAIANIPDPKVLFQVIYEMLRPIFRFDISVIVLPVDSNPEMGELFVTGLSVPESLRSVDKMTLLPVSEVLSGFDPQSHELIRFSPKELHRSRIGVMAELEIMEKQLGVTEFILCPLVHSAKVIGHLVLGNGRRGKIQDRDLTLLRQVSKIIAGAVVSTSAFAKLMQQEQDAQRLLQFTTTIMDVQDPQEFCRRLLEGIRRVRTFHFASIHTGVTTEEIGYSALWDGKALRTIAVEPLESISGSVQDAVSTRMQVVYFDADKLAQMALDIFAQHGIQAVVQIILNIADRPRTVLTFGADASQAKDLLQLGIFEQIGSQLYLAFHNLYNWEQIQSLKNRLQLENRVLRDEIVLSADRQQIIGQSSAFRKVLANARLVAPNDTTVLVLGETGTGKEVIARFLHDNSARQEKPFVRVNCAALPAQLIESELFGHEKGSFTGAVERRLGKFELAQGGTLFLDEIGELPLESQSKFLRVLQEREFERVGGHQILHADVRVIAATNRNLAEEVRKGTFRSDLYFRLSVFPITLPPLRERVEDIPLLAEAFLRRAAKKIGRLVRPMEREELELLQGYNWPGNIRELEHAMENAAILARDTVPNLREFQKRIRNAEPETEGGVEVAVPLEELIRSHILKTLRQTKGRIGGAQGAAEVLGINAKTLESKMRKLRIQRKIDFK